MTHIGDHQDGRYRVGAKTEKEAIELLRAKIGFGSIKVLYQCTKPHLQIGYKVVLKERIILDKDGKVTYKYEEPKHACAKRKDVE